ncbi:helix-hairpin-helix domain-containing protein [Streptococcus oricebi]|uniref:Competence protein CelA n=1 Tax=Streptococcus oricebi TaxID=1547447 RepID=A0ABS5B1G5_9STRE|nr:helix-hairpin-helix domain-containing protein [Streptococcus oricebi]MBP2622664.1 competence protein CelA [Streptococcus oricebi]
MLEEMIKKLKNYRLPLLFAGLFFLGLYLFWSQSQPSQTSNLQELLEERTSKSSSSLPQESKKEASQTSSESATITVDVKGAVKRPGVYQLASQSRLHDALEKAGGLTDDADSRSVNLAQKLKDEDLIYVARQGEEGATLASNSANPASSAQGQAKVNLNTASQEELQTISGIGQKKAQDIIAYRESKGKFDSVEELKEVSGIGDKTLEKLRDYVTVD